MAFRFRRTIRLAPGIRLNISKSGVSTSVGPRGASISIGKRGIYANTGIPGTGMSYRTRIDKKAPRTAGSVSKVRSEEKTASQTSTVERENDTASKDSLAASKRLGKLLSELEAYGQVSGINGARNKSGLADRPYNKNIRVTRGVRGLASSLLTGHCGRLVFILRTIVLWSALYAIDTYLVFLPWQRTQWLPLQHSAVASGLLLLVASALQLAWIAQRSRDIGAVPWVVFLIGAIVGTVNSVLLVLIMGLLVLWPSRDSTPIQSGHH
ncbi:MAG: DUF4236 domain-containing protein [Rhodobacteraceae bacterium]|nr:DUF4236 domain-containing protein [Paracoccaceae bacterium]